MEIKLSQEVLIALIILGIGTVFLFRVRQSSPLHEIPAVPTDWPTWLYRWIFCEPTPPQLLKWADSTPNDGLLCYTGIGGARRVLLTSPEAVREVMVTKHYNNFEKPSLPKRRATVLFGNGILTADNEPHRLQKKMLAPAFQPSVIRALHPIIWGKARELVRTLEQAAQERSEHVGGEGMMLELELVEWVSRATMDVIGVAVWGRDFKALADPQNDFVIKYKQMLRPGTPRSMRQANMIYAVSLLFPMDWLARIIPCEFFREKAAGAIAIRQECSAAVKSRRLAIKDNGATYNDILARTMQLQGRSLDDEALLGQMMNFLAAGHGTVSLTIVWACYLLAKHPSVQHRARREVEETLRGGCADVSTLKYLRDCVRETLRIMPVVPIIRREASKNVTILGHHIPAGTSIVCSPWVTNMQKEHWGPDASEFDPDRWTPAKSDAETIGSLNDTVPYSYIPFAVGPRACIGAGLAKAEVSIILATLLYSFQLELVDKTHAPDIIWGIATQPRSLKLRLVPVERQKSP